MQIWLNCLAKEAEGQMNTARIFKEEVSNPNIWKLMLIDLGLPTDTDEITVKAVSFMSESKRKESQKRGEKQ